MPSPRPSIVERPVSWYARPEHGSGVEPASADGHEKADAEPLLAERLAHDSSEHEDQQRGHGVMQRSPQRGAYSGQGQCHAPLGT